MSGSNWRITRILLLMVKQRPIRYSVVRNGREVLLVLFVEYHMAATKNPVISKWWKVAVLHAIEAPSQIYHSNEARYRALCRFSTGIDWWKCDSEKCQFSTRKRLLLICQYLHYISLTICTVSELQQHRRVSISSNMPEPMTCHIVQSHQLWKTKLACLDYCQSPERSMRDRADNRAQTGLGKTGLSI